MVTCEKWRSLLPSLEEGMLSLVLDGPLICVVIFDSLYDVNISFFYICYTLSGTFLDTNFIFITYGLFNRSSTAYFALYCVSRVVPNSLAPKTILRYVFQMCILLFTSSFTLNIILRRICHIVLINMKYILFLQTSKLQCHSFPSSWVKPYSWIAVRTKPLYVYSEMSKDSFIYITIIII